MFKITSKYFLTVLTITLLSKQTIALTGKDISEIVTDWLVSEGVNGKPVFSNSSVYKDCNNNLEVKKIYNNYRTVKVNNLIFFHLITPQILQSYCLNYLILHFHLMAIKCYNCHISY